jgi:ribonuclease HI
MPSSGIVAYIDGGARGNPGPAGYGVRIENPDGTLIEEFHASIGVATNNVAEYRGLLAALEWALSQEQQRMHVRSDSMLLVQQMRGLYKVKSPGLQPLFLRAQELARKIGHVTFEHVGRGLNAHADRLANAAMDAERSTAIHGTRGTQHPAPGTQHPTPSTQHPASATQSAFDRHLFTPIERAVRLFIYRHFVDTGRAPDLSAITRGTGAALEAVISALHRLAELHAIVLAPSSTSVWMAHPFSAVHTDYPVTANGRTYFANCAWDAAGIISVLGVDGESRTRCADCGEELALLVRGDRIEGEGVVHFAVPPRRFWDNIAYT